MSRIFIYDCEVFAHDWMFCFKDYDTGERYRYHNDPYGVTEFFDENPDALLCGFNNKHYDQFILKGVLAGFTPQELKTVNDFIIVEGGNGFDYEPFRQTYVPRIPQMDVMDDMQMGLSLKSIEGHLFMNIEETQVDFNIDRPLTPKEIEKTFVYCEHDVDATETILDLRRAYIEGKRNLGRMCGLTDEQAVYMTNAKLTAAYLRAKPPQDPHTDERAYQYPPNLKREFIPQEVFDFFDRIHDDQIPDDELFSSSLEITVGGCPCKVAYGGIHGAIPTYIEEARGTRVIRNYDVASLYPSLMIRCGYTSRNIPDPKLFETAYDTRLKAKREGDKVTANTLKLVLNTTYGAMLNRYNDLYDPLMGRSVCISGQLFLLELARQYIAKVPSLKLIQLNTDGVMVSLEESDLPALLAINDEWSKRTQFLLEEDKIAKIAQKDVNNYVMVDTDGGVKKKGGYLVRGLSKAGAFNVNNDAICVANAIAAYFVDGTPPEETIGKDEDLTHFQMIAKAGSKYSRCFQKIEGNEIDRQKVNRVYASLDEWRGTLYKVHAQSGMVAKIAGLPEHCIIDNANEMDSLRFVDKQWYINLAKSRINDFLGSKEEKKGRKKKMATSKMNVYQKLLEARSQFLTANVKKTGKNMHLQYMYYKLDDIVPVATPIFKTLGLLPLITFSGEEAKMTMINVEAPEETIVFTSPMREGEVKGQLPIQALGSVETYQRRYLYLSALDIVETDGIDEAAGAPEKSDKTSGETHAKPQIPATPQQRTEIKNELTSTDGNATELQVKQLKAALKKLIAHDAKYEEMVDQIGIDTEGLTKITKAECEELLVKISDILEGKE